MGESEKKEGGKENEKHEEIITAVYKLNLHCEECACAIEKRLIRICGVHKVDVELESGKVTVKGTFDPKKMHEYIGRKSRKKVEWILPKPKEREEKIEKKEEKMEKKEEVKTMVVKVHMHCENCESNLKRKILKLKGVYTVEMNREAETCTISGTIQEKKLIEYIKKTTRKHAEIVPQKQEKKVDEENKEKKEKVEVDVKKGKEETKVVRVVKEKEEVKIREVVVPYYFIHYTHAPQWFSDENPNACTVM